MSKAIIGGIGLAVVAIAATALIAGEYVRGERPAVAQDCAKACSDNQRECESYTSYCTSMPPEKMQKYQMSRLTAQDCTDISSLAAKLASRGGPLTKLVCETCAEASNLCAVECEKVIDDERAKRCAEACRKHATMCREMSLRLTDRK